MLHLIFVISKITSFKYVFIFLNISYINSFFVCPLLYFLLTHLHAPEEDSLLKALVYYCFLFLVVLVSTFP